MAKRDSQVNQRPRPAETRISTSDASKSFGEIVDRAADGERFSITRFDRERVVILARRDYDELLQLAGFTG
jgi:prevent-host-death family protein